MRILVWHVHGGWMDAFVRGQHEYLVPTTPARDAWGLGRADRAWPASVVEIDPADVADAEVDVVVLQRPEELDEARRLLGGREVPMVFVEHNAPRVDVPNSRHPLRDRDDVTIAHVTHWNALMWDCGTTRTTVVEHGVVDPGPRYTGTLDRLGVVINEPVRRGRVVGTDLLPRFAAVAPVDVWGMGTERLPELGFGDRVVARGDVPADPMHAALAERRAYVHPNRWTSLGLSLIEAMHLAMPVLVLATTDAARTVPAEAGAIATDVEQLVRASRTLLEDPDEARRRGAVAREAVLARHALGRFTADWDDLLDDAVTRAVTRNRTASAALEGSAR
ncbi:MULTISPECIES: glycosyltransferase [unclassified Curtobacterium]|uniref:glycosyltransferase n=1 Tax=unclassified Curtobacterium TaxID=257496 RepID=UPI0008DC7D88|nr:MULTISPECIES: glycosyltransferase [unclassified Curtobacterium]OII26624.1 glycosyl transferase [Curtobacterium sp. MCBA15_016]OII28597.1 glycosyl transferase [Curtobacterium sp. MCBA15_013]